MRRQTLAIGVSALVLSTISVDVHAATPGADFGYGAVLLRTIFVLAGTCLLAWVTLRWGLRRFAPQHDSNACMAVVSRLPIDPRTTLLVVRVGTRHLLVASGEGGVTRLAELDAEDLGGSSADPQSNDLAERTFATSLARVSDVSRETSASKEVA